MARAMKDSGVEWIGDIPVDWNLLKGKYLFRQRNEKGNRVELQLLSPTQKYGVIPQQMYEELSGMTAVKLDENADYSTLKSIYEGDFCISLRSFQGGFEYSGYNGVVSPAYQVFHKTADLYNDYYRYMFKDHGFISKMNSYTKTFRDGKSISFNDFGNSIIPVPPLEEQQRIATFLDSECARIDSVVEKTRASIEEYKKLKQAVITKAVTKGIRPNRTMKDIGIEWLGQIPADWELKKLKYISRFMQTKYSKQDGQLNYVGLENIVSWSGAFVKTDSAYDRDQSLICEAGDILFGKLRPYLAKVHLSASKQCCSSEFAVIRMADSQSKRFFCYQLLSHGFIFTVDSSTYGTKMPRANAEFIKNMSLVVPPLDEQKEIAAYLDEKTAAIDSLIAKKNQLVTELESLKKSLIFEYVTGKKEVPT